MAIFPRISVSNLVHDPVLENSPGENYPWLIKNVFENPADCLPCNRKERFVKNKEMIQRGLPCDSPLHISQLDLIHP